ncbi:MAG: restriction endonuclease subunit S, partial [Deferribacterales bacterium]|nr:restriction endonuclease subunit S [Deferribacterales bacterium]
MTLFKSWFIEKSNSNRKIIKAEEFFNISIGKTPPRKEQYWFSENPNNTKWVSISDMGSCGMYISDSSEYLVPEAISKFNIKVVPNNTVLLSFKLTVGRIVITDGEMTTNEAIAHFITNKKEINEYLYCYLKNFNFQTMGSTSSIATAINSKIIKTMPFLLPDDKELNDFHLLVFPMFAKIKSNQQESTRLAALRDTLLPKLMSGEIDVSKV